MRVHKIYKQNRYISIIWSITTFTSNIIMCLLIYIHIRVCVYPHYKLSYLTCCLILTLPLSLLIVVQFYNNEVINNNNNEKRVNVQCFKVKVYILHGWMGEWVWMSNKRKVSDNPWMSIHMMLNDTHTGWDHNDTEMNILTTKISLNRFEMAFVHVLPLYVMLEKSRYPCQ